MRSFFVIEDGVCRSTELARGPWSNEHQHGGPPAALMARAIEQTMPAGFGVSRLTVEFFRPVPLGVVEVSAQVARSGRKVAWLTAALSSGGKEICRAAAVAIRRAPVPVAVLPPAPSVPAPEDSAPFEFPFFQAPIGYHTAMEVRIARGSWAVGALAAWMRMRVPLVAGEQPTGLQRVVVAADSGGGISKVLDIDRYTFMNPDLSIHLHREAEGEWVCLDARTVVGADGVGQAQTDLSDVRGPIGRGVQSLLVDER